MLIDMEMNCTNIYLYKIPGYIYRNLALPCWHHMVIDNDLDGRKYVNKQKMEQTWNLQSLWIMIYIIVFENGKITMNHRPNLSGEFNKTTVGEYLLPKYKLFNENIYDEYYNLNFIKITSICLKLICSFCFFKIKPVFLCPSWIHIWNTHLNTIA